MDRKLVDLMRENSRESFVNLAKRLETSEGTVRSRVKKLQDDGVIRAFTVRVGGANIKAIIEVAAEKNVNIYTISSRIAKWKGILEVYEISGDHDILVVAEADNTNELNDIIEKIRAFPEVSSTRSRLILKEV